MNAVKIHGVLLIVALLFALQTWTRDETSSADERAGTVSLWDYTAEQVATVTYESPSRTLLLERRVVPAGASGAGETYLWGIAIPNTTPGDSGAPAASALREEFPVGAEGEELLERLAALRAMRDLGELDETAREQYDLIDPERTLTVTSADDVKELTLGGTVFGGPHRYAVEGESNHGYVISNEMLRGLEGGPATLRLRELHRYGDSVVTGVAVRTASSEREMTKTMDGPFAVWSPPDAPGDGDQTFANFMERVQQLSILTYQSDLNPDTLQFVVRIDYAGEQGAPIGFIEMYRGAPDDEGLVEYYVRTESTRVLARAYRSFAERVDQDLATVF